MTKARKEKVIVGWREWVELPSLGLPPIRAKVDTGARTSALHAVRITPFERDDRPWVVFDVSPSRKSRQVGVHCEAPVHDRRTVTSSNGKSEERYVIKAKARIGGKTQVIELTLTNRSQMGFRMLLGREALKKGFLVDPGKSYCCGRKEGKSS